MPQPRRRARFAQRTKPRRFVTKVSLVDDFQRHGALQIDVERLVSDPHSPATQLDRFAVVVQAHFIVLESTNLRPTTSILSAVGRATSRTWFPGRCRFRAESSAQDTDWTELPIGGGKELRAADRTGACFLLYRSQLAMGFTHWFSGLSFHSFSPSAAISASQSARISLSISAGSETVRATSSRNTAKYLLRRRWMNVLTVPTPMPSAFAASSYEASEVFSPIPAYPLKVLKTNSLPRPTYSSRKTVIA